MEETKKYEPLRLKPCLRSYLWGGTRLRGEYHKTGEGVIAITPDGKETLFPADTVICALGLRPRSAVVDELRKTKHVLLPIGDCTKTAQVTQAVRSGYDVAVGLD